MIHLICGNCPYIHVESMVDCICTRLSIQTTFETAICAWRRAEIAESLLEGERNVIKRSQTNCKQTTIVTSRQPANPQKNTPSLRRVRSTHALAQTLLPFGLPGLQSHSEEPAGVHDSDDARAHGHRPTDTRANLDETEQSRARDDGVRNVLVDGEKNALIVDIGCKGEQNHTRRDSENTPPRPKET
jgi:hypothetical protein